MQNNDKWLPWLALVVSFFLSPLIYHPWMIVNPDGILYAYLADLIQQYGIIAAAKHYDWFFYSLLAAKFQYLTHLSMTRSLYFMDAFFAGLIAFFFVKIIKQLGGSFLCQCLAILVILSIAGMTDYRAFIIRDHSYWAFYLASIFFLLKFVETRYFIHALCWSISALLAGLFRIEGVILVLLTPFLVFFLPYEKWSQKFKNFIKLNTVNIILLLGGVGFLLYYIIDSSTHGQQLLSFISSEVIARHISLQGWDTFNIAAENFYKLILPEVSRQKMATTVLFSGLTVFYLLKVFGTLGWFNTVVIGVGWKRKLAKIMPNHQAIIIGLIIINIVISYYFLFVTLITSARYLVALSFTLALFAPFILEKMWQLNLSHNFKWDIRYYQFHWSKYLVLVYGFVALMQITLAQIDIYVPDKQNAQIQARVWLFKYRNTIKQVCTNQAWAAFAVNREKLNWAYIDPTLQKISTSEWQRCDWLVYAKSSSDPELLSLIQSNPSWILEKEFTGNDKKRPVYVFRRKST